MQSRIEREGTVGGYNVSLEKVSRQVNRRLRATSSIEEIVHLVRKSKIDHNIPNDHCLKL